MKRLTPESEVKVLESIGVIVLGLRLLAELLEFRQTVRELKGRLQ